MTDYYPWCKRNRLAHTVIGTSRTRHGDESTTFARQGGTVTGGAATVCLYAPSGLLIWYVESLERSVAFYREAIGLVVRIEGGQQLADLALAAEREPCDTVHTFVADLFFVRFSIDHRDCPPLRVQGGLGE